MHSVKTYVFEEKKMVARITSSRFDTDTKTKNAKEHN